ncbi:MAG: GIY-YIG nuclease family protein [Candidatus Dadabacteria bacterium]|nr:GIY-YIG nuclease family protein [Candidatus Dadabacteria bacterium]
MPKTEINYSNACIYKLVCNDINIPECYVGSTTNFSQRKRTHKSKCNKNYNIYVYQFIRGHGGWDNWSMIKIEDHECKDGNDLRARERYYIEHLKAELNKTIPLRTHKEYRKQYYQDNKNKESEQCKQYYLDNSDKIKEQQKQYYLDNKEKIKEQQSQKHTCNCGGKYTTQNKSQHLKSKKHQTFISSPSSPV